MLITEEKHWILVAKLEALGGMRTIHCAGGGCKSLFR